MNMCSLSSSGALLLEPIKHSLVQLAGRELLATPTARGTYGHTCTYMGIVHMHACTHVRTCTCRVRNNRWPLIFLYKLYFSKMADQDIKQVTLKVHTCTYIRIQMANQIHTDMKKWPNIIQTPYFIL